MLRTCVILAGGRGSRLSERTGECPKPLLPVGGKPIIQRIVDFYVRQGVDDFIIPVGYLGNQIFDYFAKQAYAQYSPNETALMICHQKYSVTIVDTGVETLTGSRLKMLQKYLPHAFHFTYGDGLSNVNLQNAEEMFRTRLVDAVISAVHPEPRFGSLQISPAGRVMHFGEKEDNLGYVNGGFSILRQSVLDLIPDGQDCNLEKDIYPILAERGLMAAARHEGWWHCIDTERDLQKANEMIAKGIIE
jgi:glucose-1-phosphate cytidylyltransferase